MKKLPAINKMHVVVVALMILLGSCQDTIDNVRDNPNGVTEIDDAALFTKAVRNLFFGTADNSVLSFAGQYGHYYVAGSTARPPDQYTDGFDGSYNSIFNGMYGGVIRHIEEVLWITTNPETANPVRYAVADVVAVMGYARLTDAFGEVPYIEGGKGKTEGILLPKYDTQEFIYKDLVRRLGESIAVLKTADPALAYPGSDPMFQNDLDKWVKLANSVRLRLAMRMRFVDNALSQQIVADCLQEPLMDGNEDNAFMIDTENQGNVWYTRKIGYPSIKVSQMMLDQLQGTSDPRLPVFVAKDQNDQYTGQINGLNDAAFGISQFDSKSNMGDALSSPLSKYYVMTASEVYFLLSEIALVYENDPATANTMYQMGVQLSLQEWEIAPGDIATFMAGAEGSLAGSTEEMEEQIGTQMWVALTPNFYEGWCNIRRTGYPVIEQRTADYLHPGVTDGYLPSRYLYSSFEFSSNGTNVDAAVERQGPNKIDTPVWWDKNETN